MKLSTLCYLEQNGCYLMLHRVTKKHDVNHGKWIGVGGKFEAGEAPEECLVREVFEETGFHLTGYRYRGLLTFLYNDKEPEYIFTYTSDSFTGELHACDEGILKWVPIGEIDELELWEGDRELHRLLSENRSEPFSLKFRYHGDTLLEASELSGKGACHEA